MRRTASSSGVASRASTMALKAPVPSTRTRPSEPGTAISATAMAPHPASASLASRSRVAGFISGTSPERTSTVASPEISASAWARAWPVPRCSAWSTQARSSP